MSHLTAHFRNKIENFLNAGLSLTAISRRLERNHSTISREVQKHREEDEENKRRKRNFCVRKNKCFAHKICKNPPGTCSSDLCKHCKLVSCNQICPGFTEDSCEKLEKAPYVCNGCKEMKDCRKRKFFYIASHAENQYRSILKDARTGINASCAEIQEYNLLLKSGGRKGQSIHHIMQAHPDVMQKCEKTFYNYYNRGYFTLPRGDMPKMCMRKTRTTGTVRHKVDPQCRKGRTLEDFHRFLNEHSGAAVVQMDSVIGKIGGKVLLTLQFECGLILACLRNTNNSQSVLDYFDWLEEIAGLKLFRAMFPVILTDNGSEFSNPAAIETSKTVPQERRTYVFYCDPCASWQKGRIENNHINLRRIIEKGSAFDNLTQQDINLVLSHLNSYIRREYSDIPAFDRFRAVYGPEILDRLGLTRIAPDDVILNPSLLKGKIMS